MSNRFGRVSRSRLDSAHPDLQLIFEEVLKEFDCTIVCGHRDKQAQEAAYFSKPQRSQVRWPNSKHNKFPSMAVDAAPYDADLRGIDWDNTNRFYFFAGFVVSTAKRLLAEGRISHGLRWGGDWDSDTKTDDQKFIDLPHYELIPVGAGLQDLI